MSGEYIRISPTERIFGETNLLQTQLALLTILKQYQEYESLRKEGFFLRIELKKKLGEAKEFLEALSKSLPESKFMEEQKKNEKIQKEITEKVERAVQKSRKKEWKHWKEKKSETDAESGEPKESKPSSLDQELEEIRKKLEKLQ